MVSASYSGSPESSFWLLVPDSLVSLIHTKIAKCLLFKVKVGHTFRINGQETQTLRKQLLASPRGALLET